MSSPLIIFCADPFDRAHADPTYAAEVAAVDALGIEHHLINFEALVDEHNAAKAIRRVPERSAPASAIYRGWMLRPGQYAELFGALAERGVTLINDPNAYVLCHVLPSWYSVLAPWTPRSVWIRTGGDVSIDQIMELLGPFEGRPVIVKDFVKSRKHEWDEACYIPSSADRQSVERIVRRFLTLQGPDLAEGLVFREFEEFQPLGTHSKSGMPLTVEYRAFVLDGEPIVLTEYWDEGEYRGGGPPLDEIRTVAKLIPSRFFTADLALRSDGTWRIVELGDGQVAGLPDRADANEFYRAILARIAVV